jgi:hypothetical protein
VKTKVRQEICFHGIRHHEHSMSVHQKAVMPSSCEEDAVKTDPTAKSVAGSKFSVLRSRDQERVSRPGHENCSSDSESVFVPSAMPARVFFHDYPNIYGTQQNEKSKQVVPR